MRNAWMDASIDGRKNDISGGPIGNDGTMAVNFRLKNKGESVQSVYVRTYAAHDGRLDLVVYDEHNNEVYRHATQR
jgi:hypothetical protein